MFICLLSFQIWLSSPKTWFIQAFYVHTRHIYAQILTRYEIMGSWSLVIWTEIFLRLCLMRPALIYGVLRNINDQTNPHLETEANSWRWLTIVFSSISGTQSMDLLIILQENSASGCDSITIWKKNTEVEMYTEENDTLHKMHIVLIKTSKVSPHWVTMKYSRMWGTFLLSVTICAKELVDNATKMFGRKQLTIWGLKTWMKHL